MNSVEKLFDMFNSGDGTVTS